MIVFFELTQAPTHECEAVLAQIEEAGLKWLDGEIPQPPYLGSLLISTVYGHALFIEDACSMETFCDIVTDGLLPSSNPFIALRETEA